MSSNMAVVPLLVKNPTDISGSAPFKIEAPLSHTIRELKVLLSGKYPGRPDVERQRLIFSGNLLADDDRLSAVLSGFDLSTPQTVHLVISSSRDRPQRRSNMFSCEEVGHLQPSDRDSSQQLEADSFPNERVPLSNQRARQLSHNQVPWTQGQGGQPLNSPVDPQHASIATENNSVPARPDFNRDDLFMDSTGMTHTEYSGMPAIGPYAALPNVYDYGINEFAGARPNIPEGAESMYPQYPDQYSRDSLDISYLSHLQAMQYRVAREIATIENHRRDAAHGRHVAPLSSRNRDSHLRRINLQQNADGNVSSPTDEVGRVEDAVRAETHGRQGAHGPAAPSARNRDANRLPAENNNGHGPWVRHYVFQFELNWSLIYKLALFVILVCQEGNSFRLYALLASALMVHLWQSGRLGMLQRTVIALFPSPLDVFHQFIQPRTNNAARGPDEDLHTSKTIIMLLYLYCFAYGLVCSLVPSWEPIRLPNFEEPLDGQRGNALAEESSEQDRDTVNRNVNDRHAD